MRSFFLPLDHQRVKEQTYRNVENGEIQVHRAAAYMIDSEREKRIAQRSCRYCFHFRGGEMSGQAFTNWACGVCGKENMHPNTGTPKVCAKCSCAHELCVRCGGDIEGRYKHKQKWAELTKEQTEEIRARDGRAISGHPEEPGEKGGGKG